MLVTNKFGVHVVHREVDTFAPGIHLQMIHKGLQVGDNQPLVQALVTSPINSLPLFVGMTDGTETIEITSSKSAAATALSVLWCRGSN